ncbi:gamma-glutamyl-gamma-aminobutyrate hydrolase family protein [Fusobacterium sp.]|uniref:gamma-glutamyl-gamma-aminobutyrate hydrolase family protein n=1 Tax=Fusobacterium sp. TaxID=68766 RepID=UPI00396CDE51
MRKPVIGITSAYEMEEGLRNYHRTTVSIDYTKGVVAGGGIPVVLPVINDKEVIKGQLALLDGLLLAGGNDINPFLYGQDFKEGIGLVSPERDQCEMVVLEEFLKTGKPILGICRGHQLLNVYFKGTLHQDLRYAGKNVLKHKQDFYPELPTHKVTIIDKDNFIYRLYGEIIYTNSFHHQVLDRLGEGLTEIAHTDDGIIEAFQKKGHKFLYGIQWHPEMMTARGNKEMEKTFVEFIKACLE